MKILVDATTAEHAVGIGVVAEGFLDGLSRADCREDVIVAAGPSADIRYGFRTHRVSIARTRVGRLGFQRLLLPVYARTMRRKGIPIGGALLLDAYAPFVGTGDMRYTAFVHDVLPLTHPGYWPSSKRIVKSLAFTSLRRTSTQLLTSSAYNAEQIQRLLGMRADIALFGCGQITDAEADRFFQNGPLTRAKHVLYIGAIDERKNIRTLVDAFKLARPLLPQDMQLVLVGQPREQYGQEITDVIDSLPRGSAVQLLSTVTRSQGIDLIAKAAALVFPSHAEGFGLPVLEALAVGTPVVASDIPAIRSWAESTVTYASPTDSHALASAIEVAVRGAGPDPRKGQELARQYRWSIFAETALRIAGVGTATSC